MNNLKPCPFCGQEPKVKERDFEPNNHTETTIVSISCYGCEISMEKDNYSPSIARKEVTEKWNTRYEK